MRPFLFILFLTGQASASDISCYTSVRFDTEWKMSSSNLEAFHKVSDRIEPPIGLSEAIDAKPTTAKCAFTVNFEGGTEIDCKDRSGRVYTSDRSQESWGDSNFLSIYEPNKGTLTIGVECFLDEIQIAR